MINGLLHLSREALPIWIAGGWAMVALAVNALVIFGVGWTLLFGLSRRGAFANLEQARRKLARAPDRVRGPLSRIWARARQCPSLEAQQRFFADLHVAESRPYARDLRVMHVAVTSAPLLGLLGTVTGMLTTFRALATGGGGEKTMGMIASGISEALITTETGLVLALSGLIFQYGLTRMHERFNKNLAHLETTCMQEFQQAPSVARAA